MLRAGLDVELDLAPLERRHAHGDAERRLRDVERELVEDVVADALEVLVRAHRDLHVEMPGGTAVAPGAAAAREADLRPVVDAGGDADAPPRLPAALAATAAGGAGIGDDAALAAAARTGGDVHELPEERPLHPAELARAVALGAGGEIAPRALAGRAAVAAGLDAVVGELALDAEDRLLEVELELEAQVGAALRRLALRRRPAEEGVEDVAEAGEALEALEALRLPRRSGRPPRSGRSGRASPDRRAPRRRRRSP